MMPMLLGVAALAVIGVGVVGAIFVMGSRPGKLAISVEGPGGRKVDAVEVLIDGKVKCTSSPCLVPDVSAGTHTVEAKAPGYEASAAQLVVVQAGQDAPVKLALARASAGTGVNVAAEGSGLRIYIDGKDEGPLPFTRKDMVPGTYKVKIAGNPRLEPFEQSVTVEADKLFELTPKLKVLKGLARIKPGKDADGAKLVLVIGGTERKQIASIPTELEIDTSKEHVLIATKDGFVDFSQKLEFEPGKPERDVSLDMLRRGETPPAAPTGATAAGPAPTGATPATTATTAATTPTAATTAAPVKTGSCTLNINSIPRSAAVLDGSPVGQTPVLGRTVSPGSHSVTFIHPEKGRKGTSVNCPAGGTATAAVRFTD